LASLHTELSTLLDAFVMLDLGDPGLRQHQADTLERELDVMGLVSTKYGTLFDAYRNSQALAKGALWLGAAAIMTSDAKMAKLCRSCAARLWKVAAEALVYIRDIRQFKPDDWENVELAQACSTAAAHNRPCGSVAYLEQPATSWQLGLAPPADKAVPLPVSRSRTLR
jgi:hypothetical protein